MSLLELRARGLIVFALLVCSLVRLSLAGLGAQEDQRCELGVKGRKAREGRFGSVA